MPFLDDRITNRRQWLRYAALGGIGLGGLVLGTFKLRSKGKLTPADYRIKGNTLTVVAEDENILWQHTLKLPIWANLVDTMPSPKKPCTSTTWMGTAV